MSDKKKDDDPDHMKYYNIFGVSRNATAQEIRKAYRKLVPKLHPDKGGDKGKFEEMQNAYEVLTDPQKREIYDKYGEEGLKKGMGGEADFDPFSFFGGFGGGGQRNTRRKCKGKLEQLKVTLEEAYNGGKKDIEFQKRIICPKCKGSGSAKPDDKITCSECHGKGIKTVVQKMANMVFQSQSPCDKCNGEGTIIKEKCKECHGQKVKNIRHKFKVDIDKGVPDGHRYTFKEEGDQFPDVDNGDLIVEIYLEKHKDFIRRGADLIYKCEISLLEALTGLKFVITHLDGRKILIFTKPGEIIQPLTLKTVKELGMPFFNSPYRFGHLYIDFQIDFPNSLTEEKMKKVTEILKNERLHDNDSKGFPSDGEKYFMTEYKQSDENSNYRGGKQDERREDDDDDDEGGSSHRTVNCSSQ